MCTLHSVTSILTAAVIFFQATISPASHALASSTDFDGTMLKFCLVNASFAAGVINDMITGDTQVSFLNVASTAAQVRAGKLKPIAVVNRERLAAYPDVPTMAEVGFADVGSIAWNAMFAPAGTPKPVLETLYKSTVEALQTPTAKEALTKQNFNIVPSKSVDEAKSWLAGEIATWKKITDAVKIDVTE